MTPTAQQFFSSATARTSWLLPGMVLAVACHSAAPSGKIGDADGEPAEMGSTDGGQPSSGSSTPTNGDGSAHPINAQGATSDGGTSGGSTSHDAATGSAGSSADAGTGGQSQTDSGSNSGTGDASAVGGGTSYTTNFDLTEVPISENGAWHHQGLDWTSVGSAAGVARGTEALGVQRSGAQQYDDSYAYLSGFPPDHEVSAVVHLGKIDGSCFHEVELLLRWSDSAHNAHGYECNFAYNGQYADIVRWNGAIGDYTFVVPTGSASISGGLHEGDVISAKIVGNTITTYVNGKKLLSATDSTFKDGNPGMGFWRGPSGCGSLGDFAFTSFTAKTAQP